MSSGPPSVRRPSLRRRILFSLILLCGTYALLEGVVSLYAWWARWDSTLLLMEEPERTWQFDAVRGYRLNAAPSRSVRITNGVMEFAVTLRGNSLGFPDWDDFGPKRDAGFTRRYAVFGDSMTAGLALGQNWPERAEALTRPTGKPIQFLNFSISGGGLPNWWSVLTKVVEAENYELDGIIFAVFVDDLFRSFTICDQRDQKRFMFGTAPSRDPRTYPKTLAEARPFLSPLEDTYNVSGEEFEEALQGKWPASVPRPGFRLVLLSRALNFFSQTRHSANRVGEGPDDSWLHDPEQDPEPEVRQKLIDDIARFVKARRLPVLVVYIPDRRHLLNPGSAPKRPVDVTKAFAATLGATFLDSGAIYASMTPAEIRAQFLPYDGHHNQAGSNRLAEFVVQNLAALETAR